MYVIHFMHIDFIYSSSSDHWIKLNFNSKWTLNKNVVMHVLKFFFLISMIFKRCDQNFNLLHIYHTCYISLLWMRNAEKWSSFGWVGVDWRVWCVCLMWVCLWVGHLLMGSVVFEVSLCIYGVCTMYVVCFLQFLLIL